MTVRTFYSGFVMQPPSSPSPGVSGAVVVTFAVAVEFAVPVMAADGATLWFRADRAPGQHGQQEQSPRSREASLVPLAVASPPEG